MKLIKKLIDSELNYSLLNEFISEFNLELFMEFDLNEEAKELKDSLFIANIQCHEIKEYIKYNKNLIKKFSFIKINQLSNKYDDEWENDEEFINEHHEHDEDCECGKHEFLAILPTFLIYNVIELILIERGRKALENYALNTKVPNFDEYAKEIESFYLLAKNNE